MQARSGHGNKLMLAYECKRANAEPEWRRFEVQRLGLRSLEWTGPNCKASNRRAQILEPSIPEAHKVQRLELQGLKWQRLAWLSLKWLSLKGKIAGAKIAEPYAEARHKSQKLEL